MKEINLYTGYIDDRDVRRIEDTIRDMLTLHIGKEDKVIAEKIRDALYSVFNRIYNVDFEHVNRIDEGCDYRIRVEEAETEKFDFYTWGSY